MCPPVKDYDGNKQEDKSRTRYKRDDRCSFHLPLPQSPFQHQRKHAQRRPDESSTRIDAGPDRINGAREEDQEKSEEQAAYGAAHTPSIAPRQSDAPAYTKGATRAHDFSTAVQRYTHSDIPNSAAEGVPELG